MKKYVAQQYDIMISIHNQFLFSVIKVFSSKVFRKIHFLTIHVNSKEKLVSTSARSYEWMIISSWVLIWNHQLLSHQIFREGYISTYSLHFKIYSNEHELDFLGFQEKFKCLSSFTRTILRMGYCLIFDRILYSTFIWIKTGV